MLINVSANQEVWVRQRIHNVRLRRKKKSAGAHALYADEGRLYFKIHSSKHLKVLTENLRITALATAAGGTAVRLLLHERCLLR